MFFNKYIIKSYQVYIVAKFMSAVRLKLKVNRSCDRSIKED